MPTRTANDPFAPRGKVSRELLQRYAEGRLSAAEEHDLELAAESDPLLRDALEGLKMPGAAAASGPLERLRPAGVRQRWWVGAVVVAALLVFVISYVRSDVSGPQGAKSEVAERPAFIPTPVEPVEHARLDSELVTAQPPVITNMEAQAPERFERPTELAPPPVPAETPRPVEQPEPLQPTGVQPADVKPADAAENEPAPTLRTIVPSRQLLYRHDMKLVAPEELYAIDPLVVMDLNAVPANYADHRTRREAEEQGPTMRYADFMDRALGKYARGDARGCLEEILFLLDQYPDDVNALFYGGIAAYDLGLFSRAERYLARAAGHKVDTFNEEATWYRALSLKEDGKREEARQLFAQIVEQKGFYAARALHELEK
jgi:hypothetical protein